MPDNNIELIRKELIDLYLDIKIRKNKEVKKKYNIIKEKLFIDQIVNISNEILEQEKKNLKNLPILDIIKYIKTSLNIIIQIKAKEEIDKYKEEKEKKIINENAAEDYETLLRKEEAEIRQHISIEHQFKLHFENLAEKISELEDDNYILAKKIVSRKYIFNLDILQEKQKRKYENQFRELKNQLSFLKEQKNSYKITEKNLKKKLNLKEKEVNELKSILNTNISIKSQISSIFHEGKEEDNSKEIKEILPYNENLYLNQNKKQNRPKSLSLIEKKLSACNSAVNRRNILHTNNSNRSYNSKNLSKNKNNNNINVNKQKMEYKYKTINNIFSGNNSKKTKNDSSVRVNSNKNKPKFYSNYYSINSFRGKRLDKSDSRSLVSKRAISKSKICLPEESTNSKNHLINFNKSDINSNKNKNESEHVHSNKNKIMINYNTNIINTNVSIDKLTIKQKMKEIRKAIDEKLSEITRNRKYNIRRTISAVYDKRRNSPFYNEKLKTKREPSFRYNNINNNKINSNKLDIRTKKNFYLNKYNSNAFKQKLQNFTIQHKNKNTKKMQKNKAKYKNHSNSMFNIKNNINDCINKNNKDNNNKIFVIQAYTSKKKDTGIQLYKNKNNNKIIKIRKNSSVVNLSSKMTYVKSSNAESNINKTIINKDPNAVLTYRKNSNFNRISLFHEKLNKNSNKLKKKQVDLNNNSNKINSSLRNFIFNKCISNSNVS